MLQTLAHLVSQSPSVNDALKNDKAQQHKKVAVAAWNALYGREEFSRAFATQTATAVDGCAKDPAAAAAAKSRADARFRAGDARQAVEAYTDALRLQPGSDAAAVATLHANRAAAFLRIAEAPQPAAFTSTAVASAAATASLRERAAAARGACADATQALAALNIAAAAAAAAAGAVAPPPSGLKVKALFRRAAARRLLGRRHAALRDCDAALRACAAVVGGDSAAAADVEALRARIEGELEIEPKAPQTQQQHEQQQQQEEEEEDKQQQEPPAGPTLSQLDAFLAAHEPAPQPQLQPPLLLRARYAPQAGRRLVAAGGGVAAGTDVLTESAFVAVPIVKRARGAQQQKQFCWGCAGPTGEGAALPCGGCAAAVYCSSRCRSRSAALHDVRECGRPWPLLLPPEAWLAARMVAAEQLLSARAAAVVAATAAEDVQQAGDGSDSSDCDGLEPSLQPAPLPPWCAAPDAAALYTSLYSSLPCGPLAATAISSSSSGIDEDCARQLALACVIAAVTGNSTASGAAGALEALLRVRACGVALRDDAAAAGPGAWRGLGLFPLTAATVNHACDPNCTLRFRSGARLVLRATRRVQAGGELCISYGPQVGAASAAARRAALAGQYGFVCGCAACVGGGGGGGSSAAAADDDGDDDNGDATAVSLRCPQPGCVGAVKVPTTKAARGSDGARCSACKAAPLPGWAEAALARFQAASESKSTAAAELTALLDAATSSSGPWPPSQEAAAKALARLADAVGRCVACLPDGSREAGRAHARLAEAAAEVARASSAEDAAALWRHGGGESGGSGSEALGEPVRPQQISDAGAWQELAARAVAAMPSEGAAAGKSALRIAADAARAAAAAATRRYPPDSAAVAFERLRAGWLALLALQRGDDATEASAPADDAVDEIVQACHTLRLHFGP